MKQKNKSKRHEIVFKSSTWTKNGDFIAIALSKDEIKMLKGE